MADRELFPDFVAARANGLLRLAYLLTRDWASAEDLLQESLTKAWFAWRRIDQANPEPYVRKILVTTFSSWRRRRSHHEIPLESIGVTAAIGGNGPQAQPERNGPQALPDLPERFTADDGTEYRLISQTRLKTPASEAVRMTVPASGKPLDLAVVCDGPREMAPVDVMGGARGIADSVDCRKERQLTALDVDAESTVTLKAGRVSRGCDPDELPKDGSLPKNPLPCESPLPLPKSDWRFGVYEWTPPENPVKPSPLQKFPKVLDDGETVEKFVDSVAGTWPEKTTATITVPNNGKQLAIDGFCTGALADRIKIHYVINGKKEKYGQSIGCGEWRKGDDLPYAMSQFEPPKNGKPVTIELTVEAGPKRHADAYKQRTARWSFVVYEWVRGAK